MKYIQVGDEVFNLDHIDSIRCAENILYINFVNAANNRVIPYNTQKEMLDTIANIKIQMVKGGVL